MQVCSGQLDSAKSQHRALSPHKVLLNLVQLGSVKHEVKEDSQVKLPKYIPWEA